ncbi:hypothetical protein Pan44_45810 [Caulifigura coniformis]|uniref:Uncharacterized protein n=1 Tax=Caulifigura coniformis TaxID=2527983 RepID=A0A517SK87_9PLAN|nr:hypothetical protein [Caulifigura coniformis]QDT56526.1 hypothetical protein Pan44_45810 [Caulifigura coniformis]
MFPLRQSHRRQLLVLTLLTVALGQSGRAAQKPPAVAPGGNPAGGNPASPYGAPGGNPAGGNAPAGPYAAPGSKPAAPKEAAEKPAEKKEVERVPVKLDIKHVGRPLGKELDVSSRYYVWSDPDGWHIRSACKSGYFAGFQGEITAINGTFEKIRPIALEAKGAHPDSWLLNPERTTLKFTMHTGDKPDGFDFTIKGKDASLTFDLKIGNKERPKQIFIGYDNLHPPKSFFEFPAKH